MGRLTERIIAGLIALFLLSYVAYQGYRYYYSPVRTETVYDYSVSRSIDGRGIAIRSESVLEETVTGVENYLYEDATRVSIGQTIAEFYRSSAGDRNTKRVRELEEELRQLQEAQDTSVVNIGNAEIYNRDIKDYVAQLSRMSSVGSYENVAAMRSNLTTLINKKQIATGKAAGYEERITQLGLELQELRRSAYSETVSTVSAPVSGYFSRTVDGYEGQVSAADAAEYDLEDFLEMIETCDADVYTGGRVGKMVLNQNWYFAVAVDADDAEWLMPGRGARLQFDHVARLAEATLVKVLDHKDSDTTVLLFALNRMTEDVINLRVSGARIHFEQVTGLRISTSDIRFDEENRRGVYVLEDNVVRFRLVEALYEESGFLLSQVYYVDSLDKEHVKLFDQIIVKGLDLYDGKVIQDY